MGKYLGIVRPFFSLILLSLVFIKPAYGNCDEIDLRQSGYSMENVRPRNQGIMGTCYAHAAGKAFEAKLKLEGVVPPDFDVSIADAFLNRNPNPFSYTAPTNPEPYAIAQAYFGGKLCNVIQMFLEDGGCSEKSIEGLIHETFEATQGKAGKLSMDLLFLFLETNPHYALDLRADAIKKSLTAHFSAPVAKKVNDLYSKLIEMDEKTDGYEEMEAQYHKLQEVELEIRSRFERNSENLVHSRVLKQRAQELREAIDYLIFKNKKKGADIKECIVLRGIPLEDVDRFLTPIQTALKQIDPFDAVKQSVLALCAERIRLPKADQYECKTFYRHGESNEELHKFIGEEFSKGKKATPVGIGYNPEVLKAGKILTYSKLGDRPEAVKGGHQSLLIGRKSISGKCHYLVRNSWLPSCEGIFPEWPCEKGDVWVPADVLFEGVSNLEIPFATKSKK